MSKRVKPSSKQSKKAKQKDPLAKEEESTSFAVTMGVAALAILIVLYFIVQHAVFTSPALKKEKKLLEKLDRPVDPDRPRVFTYEVRLRRLRQPSTAAFRS